MVSLIHYNAANCGSQTKNKIKVNYSPNIAEERIARQRGNREPEQHLESVSAQFYRETKVRKLFRDNIINWLWTSGNC